MPPKKEPVNSNINTNTNNIHLNVNVPVAERTDEATKPNWYIRTILGGIIALALSIAGYYLTSGKGKADEAVVQPGGHPIEPNQ